MYFNVKFNKQVAHITGPSDEHFTFNCFERIPRSLALAVEHRIRRTRRPEKKQLFRLVLCQTYLSPNLLSMMAGP